MNLANTTVLANKVILLTQKKMLSVHAHHGKKKSQKMEIASASCFSRNREVWKDNATVDYLIKIRKSLDPPRTVAGLGY